MMRWPIYLVGSTTMLSDGEIREALEEKWIVIDPFPEDYQIQPASVDVHLGNRFGRLFKPGRQPLELTAESRIDYFDKEVVALHPGQFLLGQIKERLSLNNSIVARIEGKSSVGRKGIAIHITAGFVDPGWDGHLTIEMFNASDIPYFLRVGDPIAQLAFDRLAVPSLRSYGDPSLNSHYHEAETVQGSMSNTSPSDSETGNESTETEDTGT